jgi:hypothetical protein
VRGEATLFLLKPGHELDVDEVVEQTPGYDVVRKRSPGARLIAEATDPRS